MLTHGHTWSEILIAKDGTRDCLALAVISADGAERLLREAQHVNNNTGCPPNFLTFDSRKLMDKMFQKLRYDFVLSSSMVPPIYRKIVRTLHRKIVDYKKIKNMYIMYLS